MRLALCSVCVVLFALAAPASAEEEKVDWAKWNTWKTAKKGDWVEYAIGTDAKVRYEVLNVKGGNITYKHTTYDGAGAETGVKESTKTWDKIKLPSKLPYRLKVTWDIATATIGDVEINCETATYVSGESTMGVWYSKQVPCGGVVKSMTDGKDTVWLIAFGTSEVEAKAQPEEPKEPEDAKPALPKFFQTAGNSIQVKITTPTRTAWQLRTVKEVLPDSTILTIRPCDESGTPDASKPGVESTETLAQWLEQYSKPAESGVKVTVPAGEFTCDVFTTKTGGTEIQKWISDGALVKQVSKSGDRQTTIELVKLTMK